MEPLAQENSSRALLTVAQAAERLAVRPSTIRSWLSKGLLPRTKCGRCTRIPAGAIDAFIVAHTTSAGVPLEEWKRQGEGR
jgi:excisionase family DNA binding protein